MWKPNLKKIRERFFYDTLQTALEMKTFEVSQFGSEVVSSHPQIQFQNNVMSSSLRESKLDYTEKTWNNLAIH